MFNRRIDVDMTRIVPTSKISLKMSCLAACGNDVDAARKLYDYIASDLADLPDLDPVRPSGISQVMAGADNVFGWIGQHQQDIMQGIDMIRSLRGSAGLARAASGIPEGVPPIPDKL